MSPDLEKLFRPRSVAILGASDKNPWGSIASKLITDIGFVGPLHLVNRRGTPALGRETIVSCADADGIDAAFVAVPAAHMMDALDDMAAGGVRYGAVVTSGFAETGAEGAVAQAQLFDHARSLKITLLGPNSLGFVNFVDKIAIGAMPIPMPILPNPRVGLVSQSGATTVLIAQIAQQQNVSLTHMVAMGNEAMIDLADVVRFMVEDAATKAICVFAESIRNPASFLDAARAAAIAKKPIVILKVGTGELTATVAQAHTGALVGDDKVFQAMCDAYNIVRVNSLEDLVIVADLLAATGPVDASKGFALVSPSGGACEIVADRGEEIGISFPQFRPETLERLSGVLADFGAAHNPLDVTGVVMSKPQLYADVMEIIGKDRQFGLIGVIGEIPMSEVNKSPVSEQSAAKIAEGFKASGLPGVMIQQVMKPVSEHGRGLLERLELPVLSGGMDHAIRAIGHLFAWSRRLGRSLPEVQRSYPALPRRPIGEFETLAFLAEAGVPVIPQKLVTSRAQAVAFAATLSSPVVLKILSPDIVHKTEVGGVRLNLSGDLEVGDNYDKIMASVADARPDARIEGVIVSPMRTGGTELIVGIARDPSWGLVMAVGLGGVWVELLKDTQLRLLPVGVDDVLQALEKLKAAKLLTGYRGSTPANMNELAASIVAISAAAIAMGDDLEALEINPLRVDGAQVEALDALAIWRQQ